PPVLYCFRRCAIQRFGSGTPVDFDPLRFSLFVYQDLKQNLSFPALSPCLVRVFRPWVVRITHLYESRSSRSISDSDAGTNSGSGSSFAPGSVFAPTSIPLLFRKTFFLFCHSNCRCHFDLRRRIQRAGGYFDRKLCFT